MESKNLNVNSIDEFTATLRDWYAGNTNGFADDFNAAVANVNPVPANTPQSVVFDWQNATIDTLCQFFESWYAWNPNLTTGLEYIQKFSWLYYENKQGLSFVTAGMGLLATYAYVKIIGQKMDSPESKSLVDTWMAELGNKMDAYIIPSGGFQNFNQFFARELKPGQRPISSPQEEAVVVSPADAIVNVIDDNLTLTQPLNVKTQKLNVQQLLNGSSYAANFEGGTAISCILMPTVYHRFHAPVTGTVVEADEDVAGTYFGISDFPELLNGGNVGYGYDYSVFEHFRRGYLIIETEKYGYVAMIPVGLNTISSVIFEAQYKKVDGSNPVPVTKGDEVGCFQYGGSLNILLFESDCFPALRIPQGQIIGTMEEKKRPKIQFTF